MQQDDEYSLRSASKHVSSPLVTQPKASSIVSTSINILRVRDPSAHPSITTNPYFKYHSTALAYASTKIRRHPELSFKLKARLQHIPEQERSNALPLDGLVYA
jgi:hypothetical protein